MLTSNLVPCFVQTSVVAMLRCSRASIKVCCSGCGARTDLEYAEEFAADLWNERVSYID